MSPSPSGGSAGFRPGSGSLSASPEGAASTALGPTGSATISSWAPRRPKPAVGRRTVSPVFDHFAGAIPFAGEDRTPDLGTMSGLKARLAFSSVLSHSFPRFLGSVPVQTFESIVEADYNVQARRWLSVRPNVQCVIKPNGTGKIPNAFVIGLCTGVTF